MSGLHPQNYVSFGNNKAPNITTISGCNIGCRFYKYVIIESISEKPEITAETAVQGRDSGKRRQTCTAGNI